MGAFCIFRNGASIRNPQYGLRADVQGFLCLRAVVSALTFIFSFAIIYFNLNPCFKLGRCSF